MLSSQPEKIKCCDCKNILCLKNFYRDSSHKSGYQRRCKSCTKTRNNKFKERRPNYAADKGKAKYAAIPDKTVYNQDRYRNNKERYKQYNESRFATPRGRLSNLLDSAKARAKKKPLPFDLTLDWLENQYYIQNGSCVLTGIPFDLKRHGKGSKHYNPFSPSIDRIHPELGYVTTNVRLILTGMNLALNDFGDSVYQTISIHYLIKQGFKVQAPP